MYLKNYGWKFPKAKEGNRYPGTEINRGSQTRWTQTDTNQDVWLLK